MTEALTVQNDGLSQMLTEASGRIQALMPQWMNPVRLLHLAITARSRSPLLLECSPQSWLDFTLRCAETGMEPVGAGGAWAVPFKNSKTGQYEVQFIADYRGLIDLAVREGKILNGYADVIRQGDEWDYQKGSEPRLMHKPKPCKADTPVIAAYFVAVLPAGGRHIEVMWRDDVDAIRSRSKSSDSGPWVTDYNAMCCKTVTKRGMKPFMGSPRIQAAVAYDNEAAGLNLPDMTPIREPQAKPAKPSAPPTEEGKTVQVDVENAGTKTGGTEDKPWTRFWIKGTDGAYYSTFDKKLGAALLESKGASMTLRIKRGDKGNDVLAIVEE